MGLERPLLSPQPSSRIKPPETKREPPTPRPLVLVVFSCFTGAVSSNEATISRTRWLLNPPAEKPFHRDTGFPIRSPHFSRTALVLIRRIAFLDNWQPQSSLSSLPSSHCRPSAIESCFRKDCDGVCGFKDLRILLVLCPNMPLHVPQLSSQGIRICLGDTSWCFLFPPFQSHDPPQSSLPQTKTPSPHAFTPLQRTIIA